MSMFNNGPGKGFARGTSSKKTALGAKRMPGVAGEPPNRTRSPQRKPMPARMPKEGDTRTKKIMTQPPKIVKEVYRNGQWVPMPSAPKAAARGKKPMDLNDAIRGMQRDQPWN